MAARNLVSVPSDLGEFLGESLNKFPKVSARNHGFEPLDYLDAIPADRVVQVHLAGHSVLETHRLDTHSAPVCDEVWALYERVLRRLGPVTTLIEWDDDIPSLERLEQEAVTAAEVRARALA